MGSMIVWENNDVLISSSKEYSREFYVEDKKSGAHIRLPKDSLLSIIEGLKVIGRHWMPELESLISKEEQERNYWKARALQCEMNSTYAMDFLKRLDALGAQVTAKTSDFPVSVNRIEDELKKIWLALDKIRRSDNVEVPNASIPTT